MVEALSDGKNGKKYRDAPEVGSDHADGYVAADERHGVRIRA